MLELVSLNKYMNLETIKLIIQNQRMIVTMIYINNNANKIMSTDHIHHLC